MEAAEIESNETVLEIGPGLGVLTFLLAEQAKEVISIELESLFADYIRDEAGNRGIDNITVMRGDALRLELPDFDKVVSNLPYNISSPLTFRLLSQDFTSAVLMYQREFGLRLLTGQMSGYRGALTFKAHYYADIESLFGVSAEEFYPVPKIDSLVVKMVKRKFPYELTDVKFYFRLIEVLFQQRRKMVRNGLLLGFMNLPGVSGISKETFKSYMADCIPGNLLDRRPEDIQEDQMVLIANRLMEKLH